MCGTRTCWKSSANGNGEVGDGPLVPLTYCDENDICKKLNLGPDMTKVQHALNIHIRFREWRWLLNEHRKEVGGLPLLKMEDGSCMART
ncbi:cyclic dof factor 2 [Prunus yedoensis var. nudiflora]|uniref:Cyclic dof factor 2 n=1 Tax=Prunus yedoensis var. nudiflora TaxID=2094558 RepID=A0A314YVA3_PRUYE|nr:cyclic dof factor 2 [Prunus yedoensis var. nudiflora]